MRRQTLIPLWQHLKAVGWNLNTAVDTYVIFPLFTTGYARDLFQFRLSLYYMHLPQCLFSRSTNP